MVRCYRCEYGACLGGRTSSTGAPLLQECVARKFCFLSTGREEVGGREQIVFKRGCDDTGLACHMTSKIVNEKMNSRIRMSCCSTDHCNNASVPFPVLPESSVSYSSSSSSGLFNNDLTNNGQALPPHSLVAFFAVFLVLAVAFFVFVFAKKRLIRRKRKQQQQHNHNTTDENSANLDNSTSFESGKRQFMDHHHHYRDGGLATVVPLLASQSQQFSSGNAEDLQQQQQLQDYYVNEANKLSSGGDQSHSLREQQSSSAMIDGTVSSGSGSGLPLLIQRTLAREIKLEACIGAGRYGEVWRGDYRCEKVAVKIFYSRDEASFQREVEIYSIILMKSENILPFIGSDVTSVSSCTQLWLVTTYYPLGSLFDYLSGRSLRLSEMFTVLSSITAGIAHLHIEYFGVQGKPAIAHRDIKSKNILIKSDDGTCCIADFGLAVTHKQTTGSLNIASNYRVGTKRYMAPEVLSETMNSDNFDSYRCADIYSLALVFWEVYNRLEIGEKANDYAVPFQHVVPSDPSFEDMRQVVCVKGLRPQFVTPPVLDSAALRLLTSIEKLIAECWSEKPSSRLTSQCIKKKIAALMSKEKGTHSEKTMDEVAVEETLETYD